jgi:hypothetical protein
MIEYLGEIAMQLGQPTMQLGQPMIERCSILIFKELPPEVACWDKGSTIHVAPRSWHWFSHPREAFDDQLFLCLIDSRHAKQRAAAEKEAGGSIHKELDKH